MKKIFAFLMIISFGLLLFIASPAIASANVGYIDNLVCNPGEDSSTSLRFTWNSSEKKTAFYYTVSSDTEFRSSSVLILDGEYDNTTFPNTNSDTKVDVAFYNYNVELTDLTPGTTYIYKVKAGGQFSKVHKATTAELDGSFNFIWISDTHAHCNITKRHDWAEGLVKAADTQSGGASLIVSSGDSVAYGSYYDDWLQWSDDDVKSNFIWACVPGNHDYYCRTTKSSVMWNQSPVGYKSIYWEANNNPPENGLADWESNYYFLYNNVLFIGLDSILQEKGKQKEIRDWFEDVMAKMEGKYQYIIVYQHYPMFDGEAAEPDKYGSCGYKGWQPYFDKYGVDLVLSGDSHVYLRSYTLKDNKVDPTGTTYVNAPQIGDRYRYIEANESPDKIAFRYSSYSTERQTTYNSSDYLKDNSGLTYFKVTPEGISATLIDTTYNAKDTYTITPIREVPKSLVQRQEAQEDAFISSARFINNADGKNEFIYFDGARLSYVKSLKAVVAGQEIPFDLSSNKLSLGELTEGKGYEVSIEIEFISGNKKTTTVYGSTYSDFGVIDGLKLSKKEGNLFASWNAELQNGIIGKYQVYHNGSLIGESQGIVSELLCSEAPVVGDIYELIALSQNGEKIYSVSAMYKVMGDANDDGIVNVDDCHKISQMVFSGDKFNETSTLCADINLDEKVDYKDVIAIWNYLKGASKTLDTSTQKVTFRDINGNAIKVLNVKTGDNAVAPTAPVVEGMRFVRWSQQFSHVTCNLTVYAIYELEK